MSQLLERENILKLLPPTVLTILSLGDLGFDIYGLNQSIRGRSRNGEEIVANITLTIAHAITTYLVSEKDPRPLDKNLRRLAVGSSFGCAVMEIGATIAVESNKRTIEEKERGYFYVTLNGLQAIRDVSGVVYGGATIAHTLNDAMNSRSYLHMPLSHTGRF